MAKNKDEYVNDLNEILGIDQDDLDLSKLTKDELIHLTYAIRDVFNKGVEKGRLEGRENAVGDLADRGKKVFDRFNGPIAQIVRGVTETEEKKDE